MWRSLATRLVWDQEIGGSNPSTQTDVSLAIPLSPHPARLTSSRRSSSTVRAPPCQGGRWQFESALRRQGSIVHGIRSRTFNPWNWVRVPVELPEGARSDGLSQANSDQTASLLPFRDWCNRQHARFWSSLWGFESLVPSHQGSKGNWWPVSFYVWGWKSPSLPDSTTAVQRPVKARVGGSNPPLAALG